MATGDRCARRRRTAAWAPSAKEPSAPDAGQRPAARSSCPRSGVLPVDPAPAARPGVRYEGELSGGTSAGLPPHRDTGQRPMTGPSLNHAARDRSWCDSLRCGALEVQGRAAIAQGRTIRCCEPSSRPTLLPAARSGAAPRGRAERRGSARLPPTVMPSGGRRRRLLDHGARDPAGCDSLRCGALGSSGSVEVPTLRRHAGRCSARPRARGRHEDEPSGGAPDRGANRGAKGPFPRSCCARSGGLRSVAGRRLPALHIGQNRERGGLYVANAADVARARRVTGGCGAPRTSTSGTRPTGPTPGPSLRRPDLAGEA